MALDESTLKNEIKGLLVEMETRESDAKEYFATQLAAMIVKCIKTADVKVIANASEIKVVGSSTAQQNASPINILGSPSSGGGLS